MTATSTLLHIRALSNCFVRTISVLLFVMVASSHASLAGDNDTRGKEFWVAFMLDHGNTQPSDLRLYFACDKPTTVYVIYTVTNDTIVVPLSVPNKTVELDINNSFFVDAELRQLDQGVSQKSFHILADDDINLYGVNVNSKSADSFLGLPDKVLTGKYIVLAYPNGYSNIFNDYDEESEFAVVGTEDNTTVRVSPPAGVHLNGSTTDTTFTIILHRGDVYFAQAQVFVGEEDVSGTEILANKPVAVFGGNARTAIPTMVGNYRDHLVEQMPPLDCWGNEGIVPPLFNITPWSVYTAAIRVLSAFDGTQWTLDGVPQVPLSRGRSVEVPLAQTPRVIKADLPILIGQYEHSVGVDDPDGQPALGDPFFLIVPPSEQFDTAYAFQSITHPEFIRHFINVVVPTVATSSMELDTKPLLALFKPIPATRYSYAQIEVQGGAHFIRCDSSFGLYVYGYGRANSYGNTGGMLFRTLVTDFFAPEMRMSLRCSTINGIAWDSRITDSGVDSCYVTKDTLNCRATIEPFTPGADTVYYSATLIDPYQDGRVGVKSIDSIGRSRTLIDRIPGYTLRATGMVGNTPELSDTLFVYNGKQYCKSIIIQNYGKFQHVINTATFSDPTVAVTFRTPLPLVIPAGLSDTLEFCVGSIPDTSFTITLSIADTCISRTIAVIPVVCLIDTTAPAVNKPVPCGNQYQLTIDDPSGSGIQAITLDTIINGTLTFNPDPSRLPSRTVTGNIVWGDRRQDVIFQIAFTDRAGNTSIERDTIGGFTLAVLDRASDSLGTRFGVTWVSDTVSIASNKCDSITLVNYGARTLHIDHIKAVSNSAVSIPPAQFPIDIPRSSTRRVAVCYRGVHDIQEIDTLIISDGCGMDEVIPMNVPTRTILAMGSDRCNTTMEMQLFGASKRVFLQGPHPNPTSQSGQASVDIGLDIARSIQIELYDMYGNRVSELVSLRTMPAGIHRLHMDLNSLPTGAYVIRMTSSDAGMHTAKLLICK